MTLLAMLAGALWGGYLARSRGGNKKDIAQYAVGFAIFFALVTLVTLEILRRMGVTG